MIAREATLVNLDHFIAEHKGLLDSLPGMPYEGNMTGLGPERLQEVFLSSCEGRCGESTEQFLVLSIFENKNGGPLDVSLMLQNHSEDAGVTDRTHLPITEGVARVLAAFSKLCVERDLIVPEYRREQAHVLINVADALKAQVMQLEQPDQAMGT